MLAIKIYTQNKYKIVLFCDYSERRKWNPRDIHVVNKSPGSE